MKKLSLHDFGFTNLQIETQSSCNMRCAYCPYTLRNDKSSVLSDKIVKGLLNELDPKSPSLGYIGFNQFNEPLLDSRIFAFIRHAGKCNFKTMLFTNALLLAKRTVIDDLLSANPDCLKISLQIVNKDRLRYVKGIQIDGCDYFHIIYETLAALKDAPIKVEVDVACNFSNGIRAVFDRIIGLSGGEPSVTSHPGKLGNDLHDFLHGLQVTHPEFEFDLQSLEGFLEKLTPWDYALKDGFPLAGNINLKVKRFIYGRKIADFYPAKHAFGCSAHMLTILANGHVVPCYMIYNHEDLSLGNVYKDDLNTILTNSIDILNRIRAPDGDKPDVCKACYGAPTRRGAYIKKLLPKHFPNWEI